MTKGVGQWSGLKYLSCIPPKGLGVSLWHNPIIIYEDDEYAQEIFDWNWTVDDVAA